MSIEDIKKKEIESEQLDNVTGGYFVTGLPGDGSGSGSGTVNITVYHICKSCSHTWEADHEDTSCPECGGTEIKIFVC